VTVLDIIERKKVGKELSAEELGFLCRGVADGTVPDYQIAAWLMAVYFRGMTEAETLAFTRSLASTGRTLDWSHLPRPPADKHSTGGVGDKTSLVLVPLMAAAGIPMMKMSGRGLGLTGGTIDKLESIPGFQVELSPDALREQILRVGCAIVGQSSELVPADAVLYALRDVTATVDSVPLIASSIMAKKLAAGAGTIVLDVKYGSGAFMRDRESARELAAAMVKIGVGAGRRVAAVLSAMEEPLGSAVGNSLEVQEAVETLRGGGPADLWELARELGSQILILVGDARDVEGARARLDQIRSSGAAFARFGALVEAQGGDPRSIEEPSRLPTAPRIVSLEAASDGWIRRVDAKLVAEAALRLGAGRVQKTDAVDLAVGLRILKKRGAPVRRGEPIAEIHARDPEGLERAGHALRRACEISEHEVEPEIARYEVIRFDA
jgi:pyrimidine-nucleoside phosphorylase